MAKIDFLEAKYFDSTPDLKANKKNAGQKLAPFSRYEPLLFLL